MRQKDRGYPTRLGFWRGLAVLAPLADHRALLVAAQILVVMHMMVVEVARCWKRLELFGRGAKDEGPFPSGKRYQSGGKLCICTQPIELKPAS